MNNLIGMLPLALFTLVAIMYHIGHNEYKKRKNKS